MKAIMQSCVVLSCAITFAFVHGATRDDRDKTKLLNEWFRQHAVVHDKVEIGNFEGVGRGISVMKPIKKNELVMSFPTKMTISHETAKASPIGAYLTPNVSPTDAVVIQLMYEKANIANSKWRPWIDALPQKFETAITATDTEIAMLENPSSEQDIKQARAQIKQDYAELKQTMFSPHPKIFPKDSYNWESYRWSRLMVDSRCWSLQGRRVCMPGGDFFNYAVSEEQLDPNSDLMGNFFVDYHKLSQDKGTEVVEIYSDRDAAVGEQLYEAYGESNNVFLATWFGFAPIPNPSDYVELQWLFRPGRGFHSEEKLAMLNLFRGAVRGTFKVRKLDVLPQQITWYLKVTTLPPHLMSECSRSSDQRALLKCIAPHKAAAIYDEFLELLEEKLERYSTSLEEDEKLLSTADISPKHALMITVRKHHKMILRHNIELGTKLAAAAKDEL